MSDDPGQDPIPVQAAGGSPPTHAPGKDALWERALARAFSSGGEPAGASPPPGASDESVLAFLTRRGESLTTHPKRYDTLVSINVIEHVQNAFEFLKGLHTVLKVGGTLVFHERYFDSPPAGDAVLGRNLYHPVRITREVLDVFLRQFEVLMLNVEQTAGMKRRNAGEHGYYVIARKKGKAAAKDAQAPLDTRLRASTVQASDVQTEKISSFHAEFKLGSRLSACGGRYAELPSGGSLQDCANICHETQHCWMFSYTANDAICRYSNTAQQCSLAAPPAGWGYTAMYKLRKKSWLRASTVQASDEHPQTAQSSFHAGGGFSAGHKHKEKSSRFGEFKLDAHLSACGGRYAELPSGGSLQDCANICHETQHCWMFSYTANDAICRYSNTAQQCSLAAPPAGWGYTTIYKLWQNTKLWGWTALASQLPGAPGGGGGKLAADAGGAVSAGGAVDWKRGGVPRLLDTTLQLAGPGAAAR